MGPWSIAKESTNQGSSSLRNASTQNHIVFHILSLKHNRKRDLSA
jgi:hypothetical protein